MLVVVDLELVGDRPGRRHPILRVRVAVLQGLERHAPAPGIETSRTDTEEERHDGRRPSGLLGCLPGRCLVDAKVLAHLRGEVVLHHLCRDFVWQGNGIPLRHVLRDALHALGEHASHRLLERGRNNLADLEREHVYGVTHGLHAALGERGHERLLVDLAHHGGIDLSFLGALPGVLPELVELRHAEDGTGRSGKPSDSADGTAERSDRGAGETKANRRDGRAHALVQPPATFPRQGLSGRLEKLLVLSELVDALDELRQVRGVLGFPAEPGRPGRHFGKLESARRQGRGGILEYVPALIVLPEVVFLCLVPHEFHAQDKLVRRHAPQVLPLRRVFAGGFLATVGGPLRKLFDGALFP
ncbi:MAG: hypothetical protein BWX71_00589 [Deltaproteobacteria bacterium ADurb.Bin072]|nr:MAG: hypothetical protein BWX71_00589 [Deltaproteobacteria bacterium ADurb.Bin072]